MTPSGVLQQRPSQGWGTVAELSDVATATGRFLDHLVEVKDWQTIDLADAIQQVQNSIDGSLYDQHARQAQAMADVFAGTVPRGITCHFARANHGRRPDDGGHRSQSGATGRARLRSTGRTITVPGRILDDRQLVHRPRRPLRHRLSRLQRRQVEPHRRVERRQVGPDHRSDRDHARLSVPE